MRRWFLFLAICGLATAPAISSEEFCIRFQDIPLNGSALCGPEYSRAFEYHHLAARDVSGGTPGPVQHRQIIVTKMSDAADPQLWERLQTGMVIPEVLIESPPPGGGSNRERFRYTLTNARVLGIEPIIPHVQDPGNTSFGDQTRIRLDYQSLTIEVGGANPVVVTP